MPADSHALTPGSVTARQDSIAIWSLPFAFVFIIGVGFLFTFYDIFDINVSFIQTCLQIIPACHKPPDAGQFLGQPVLWNLIGYVIGTLIMSPLADRFGRREMLVVTMVITGLGSLFTAFVSDYNTFIIARTITGIGIGADLAIVNTYINEVAPRNARAKYTALVFTMSALGAFLGIWLGLLLTTAPTPFPLGLPFALAGANFSNGWRIMYVIGGALALVGVLLRVQLPESPRWLVSRGKLDKADAVVQRMERYAATRSAAPVAAQAEEVPVTIDTGNLAFGSLFRNPLYVRRLVLLLVVWLTGYVTVYSFAAGLTTILATLNYPPPEAGLITAVGTFGFIACGAFSYAFAERLERKLWLPIAAVLTLIGGILIAVAGKAAAGEAVLTTAPIVAFIGAIIVFFGFNIWIPATYAWSTENFPTRARTTGFGIVDGIGHVGGGIGLLLIAPNLAQLGPLNSFLLIGAFLVVAAVIAQFGIATRGVRLDVVSP